MIILLNSFIGSINRIVAGCECIPCLYIKKEASAPFLSALCFYAAYSPHNKPPVVMNVHPLNYLIENNDIYHKTKPAVIITTGSCFRFCFNLF
ncbi:hypothetical protein AYY16_01015 [Morganella psychrotolerans]|nr:hypothetical protein AYY16_01015 [Morganella psychrotolerans]